MTEKPIPKPAKGNNEKSAVSAAANSAAVISDYTKYTFGDMNNQLLYEEVSKRISGDRDKNIGRICKEVLLGQVLALQAIFTDLSRRASTKENAEQFRILLSMAFKAQNQCRSTVEVLSVITRPPAIYAQQANIAQGHQQVNNGESFASQKIKSGNNEVMGVIKDEQQRMDTISTSQTIHRDPEMETVGEVNRGQDN